MTDDEFRVLDAVETWLDGPVTPEDIAAIDGPTPTLGEE